MIRTDNEIWYKISANKIAREKVLNEMKLTNEPRKGDKKFNKYQKLFKLNLAKLRGVKYGVRSYSQMYMRERKKILGDWYMFFNSFCDYEKININNQVLVTGVNDGQEIGFLKSRNIIGLDISKEAINRGKKLYPHINFVYGDLVSFALKDNSIETCISLRTLHFLEKKEIVKVITNTFNFLRKGGKLVVSVPGGFLTEEDMIIFGQKVADDSINKEKPMSDVLQIQSIIEKIGFTETKIIDHQIEIFVVGTKK